ncbi:MAG: hypothetical protein K8I65_07455 [Thermoanaerobaculia bacterium]|nr:hypothetical protein [Thermoanaerobaculia bacterium]
MRRLACLAAALAPLAAAPLTAAVGPWSETPEAKVRLVSSLAVATPGGPAGLGLEFVLAPGWHVYWLDAGDAGYPPELTLPAETPLRDVALRYPAPHRFDLPGDLVAFGYEGEVIYPVDAAIAPDAAGPLPLAVRLDYLVCAATCIPYRAELTLELPLAEASREDAAEAARLATWRARLPRQVPGEGGPAVAGRIARGEGGGLHLVLDFAAAGLEMRQPDLFFAPHRAFRFGRPHLQATAAGPAFEVPLSPVDLTRPMPGRIAFDWTATGLAIGEVEAWTGRLDLELPPAATAAGSTRRPLWIAGFSTAILLLVLAARRRRRGR